MATEPPLHTRGRARAALALAGYQPDVKRCDICKHFARPAIYLVNSLPQHSPSRCKLHNVRVRNMGICYSWEARPERQKTGGE